MNRLPREICDEIGSLCSENDTRRSSLAAVSRPWQMIIERQTFQSLCLKNTDLDSFERIFGAFLHRRCFLENIILEIVLPEYSDEARGRFEREPDRQANNEVFSAAIHGLFRILNAWGECNEGTISLTIGNIASPMDGDRWEKQGIIEAADDVQAEEVANRDLRHRRFQYSYLCLLQPDRLPKVPVIAYFGTGYMIRRLAYRTTLDIAAKLPNLLGTQWHMTDTEQRYPALRRENHRDLIEAIQVLLPKASNLQELHILMDDGRMDWNPDWLPADLRFLSTTVDSLGSAIRKATAHLKNLNSLSLIGTFDSSLLWPGPVRSPAPPFWQNLESPFPPSTPSMTEMPPGYGYSEEQDITAALRFSDEENRLHSGQKMFYNNVEDDDVAVPDETSIVPLMKAFGRACTQIPTLKVACLETEIPQPRNDLRRLVLHGASWGVSYLAPLATPKRPKKTLDLAFSEDIGQRRLFWDVGKWRPKAELRGIFRAIGREIYGDTLVEKFVDNYTAFVTSLNPDWRNASLRVNEEIYQAGDSDSDGSGDDYGGGGGEDGENAEEAG
ncbi:hypothetical protein PT974_07950 [Cladobotryum mycophilum]|uniref:F-box domain-containing protein n=1 Tax=Cladobotryum mycophilum TaxID=491253 RepID=A0ABR0SC12_9HYPO